jgi:hypothetical protein
MESQQTVPSQSESVQYMQKASGLLYSQVGALSPDLFLTGAAASIALSLFLRVTGRQHDAQFVGQWAPTFLLLGLYTRGGQRGERFSHRFESREGNVGQEVH